MGGVVVAVGVLLIVLLWAAVLVAMFRGSSGQRARTKRTDFGGRYTFLGYLLGVLRDDDRRKK